MMCCHLGRQYNRLVKSLKPDMAEYEAKREAMGDAFYADTGTIVHGQHKDSKEAIDRLANDVEKQWVHSHGAGRGRVVETGAARSQATCLKP